MTDASNDEHLHDEAEEIRKETAEGSPEVAEADAVRAARVDYEDDRRAQRAYLEAP